MTVSLLRLDGKIMNLFLSSLIVAYVAQVNSYTQIHKQMFRRTTVPLSSDRGNIVFMNPEIDTIVFDEKEEVMLVDGPDCEMNAEQKTQLSILSKNAPQLVEVWLALVLENGKSDKSGIIELLKSIGPIPTEDAALANWIGLLISPVASLGVGVDIVSALNSCKNNFQRVKLATIALQMGIDNMSGKIAPFLRG